MPLTSPAAFDLLRKQARQRLEEGALPPAPNSVFAGVQQRDELCAVCGLHIQPQQIAYEIDIEADDSKRTLYVHPNCHAAWQAESSQVERNRG